MEVGPGDKGTVESGPPNLCGRDDPLATMIRTAPACVSRRWFFHPRVAGEESIKTRRIILEPQGLVNYKGIVGLPPTPMSLIWNKNAYFMLVTLLHFEST